MNRSRTVRLAACRRAFSITVLILALLLPTLVQAEPQTSFRAVPRYGSFNDLKGDERATKIAAYLVPADYDPPSRSGQASLPVELENNAVAMAVVARNPRP